MCRFAVETVEDKMSIPLMIALAAGVTVLPCLIALVCLPPSDGR